MRKVPTRSDAVRVLAMKRLGILPKELEKPSPDPSLPPQLAARKLQLKEAARERLLRALAAEVAAIEEAAQILKGRLQGSGGGGGGGGGRAPW